jgi:hypothetical protein
LGRKITGALTGSAVAAIPPSAHDPDVPDSAQVVDVAQGKKAGRPPELSKGTRKQVYLDYGTIRVALELGRGNLSEGLREACRRADPTNEVRSLSAAVTRG